MPEKHPSTIGPEAELLVACARTELDPARTDRVAALVNGSLDWDRLMPLAARHGLMPLLGRHLSDVCREAVPSDVMERLDRHEKQIRGRNLFLTSELLDALRLLKSRGIDAIPMRGPLLTHSLYGDLALREFSDLDVLVRRRDASKAWALLVENGYSAQYELTEKQERAFIHYQDQAHFDRGDGVTFLEIHWEIVPRFFSFALCDDDFWDRHVAATLGDARVWDFSPGDHLLALCAHGAKHLWARLIWICDVARLLETHQEIDWDSLRIRARELGGSRMVFLGLALTHDLLGASLPDDVLREVRSDRRVADLAAQVVARLFRESDDPPGLVETVLSHLRARERLADRLRYSIRMPTSLGGADIVGNPLLERVPFLGYLWRPLRLIAHYGFPSRK